MLPPVVSSGEGGPKIAVGGKEGPRGGGFAICTIAPKKRLNNIREVVPSPSSVSSLIDVSPSAFRAKVEL